MNLNSTENRQGQRFHFFPSWWTNEADWHCADLLIAAGFREVTASSKNYGPVHHSGQISEHSITFRRPIVEEATHCAGLEVKWYEFPPPQDIMITKWPMSSDTPWHFRFYAKEFPEGFQLPRDDEPLKAPYWDQGRAPHFWLYKRTIDDTVGEQRSRITESSMNHLDLKWTRYLQTFDADAIDELKVMIDRYAETRQLPLHGRWS